MSMRRVVSAILAVACTGVVLAGPNHALARGATKVNLMGPGGEFYCATGIPVDARPQDAGFVIIHQVGNTVTASVLLKHVQPNTTYVIRLVQADPSGNDCFQVDGRLVTNAAGNGHLRVSEPLQRDAVAFNVVVDTRRLFGAPYWVGEHRVLAE